MKPNRVGSELTAFEKVGLGGAVTVATESIIARQEYLENQPLLPFQNEAGPVEGAFGLC